MSASVLPFRAGGEEFELGPAPWLMGIVNATPDSFSDAGLVQTLEARVDRARWLLAAGADLIDVGGESGVTNRPAVDPAEEISRVVPLIERLVGDLGARVSVDTMRGSVAAQAVEAGASIVNDVSGGLADPDMARVVATARVPFVVMHWRGHSDTMQDRASYDDVVADVCRALSERVADLCGRGVGSDQLILDPGFGFAKLAEHNWSLLAHLGAMKSLGFPVLVGTSRKTFLGALGVPEGGVPRLPAQRDVTTAATTVIAGLAGVWGVRVHDVASSIDALRVVAAVEAAR